MDPLSDAFTARRVERANYTRVEATAPWGISFGVYPHSKFGMVLRGACWLTVDGAAGRTELREGDCYFLPRGNAFTLRDSIDTPTRQFADILAENQGNVVRCGGGDAPTTIIGGRFVFDGPVDNTVTDLLPALIHIKAEQSNTFGLQTTLQFLASETAAPSIGSQLVVNRLADILFVQAIRAHLSSDGLAKTGWLGALSDQHIGAALRLMHEQTARPWTLEALAATVGMSRSAFATQFKTLVGETPIDYLTRWRMYKASRLLRESDMKLLQVASAVGYDSDGAFNKAFKRVLGVTPGEYRRKDIP